MYSSWAQRQRKKLIFLFSIVAFTLLSVYLTIGLYAPPSCFDEKKNQDELEIDCGGSCSLMCASQIQPLNTIWVRSYESSPGLWSAFAYIENSNPAAEVLNARYRFKLFDKDNVIIKEIEDSTFITQEIILPVFSGRIDVGDAKPYRTEFEWIEPLVWTSAKNIYKVELEEQKLSNATKKPEITGVIVNKEAFRLENVEVVAIVYNTQENVIAVSKTYVDAIPARGKQNITFSWPYPFNAFPYRWQLIARVPAQEE